MELLAYVMGFFYIAAGVNHFIMPRFYVRMIKEFISYPLEMVYLSGIIEIMLGMGLFFQSTRSLSAIGIILLLIAIYPANIYMAMHSEKWDFDPRWHYLRLPLQFLFIYLAWIFI